MMRTTAFPAAIVTWMAAAGEIDARGVLPQERAVDPARFIPRLAERGIELRIAD
jgi:saccharopine dehydrogenase-like NADP-dependent oxidoreductase